MGVNLGKYIRSKRKDKGLAVKTLAKEAEISKSYLDYIESGQREPSPEKLKSIALALDVDIEELIKIQSEDNMDKAKNIHIDPSERRKMAITFEENMLNSMSEYLENEGWDIRQQSSRLWGDLLAVKGNENWIIEFKVILNDRVSMSTVYGIIGQLMVSIESLGYDNKYSIVSNNEKYIYCIIESLPRIITNSINLTFFVINEDWEIKSIK